MFVKDSSDGPQLEDLLSRDVEVLTARFGAESDVVDFLASLAKRYESMAVIFSDERYLLPVSRCVGSLERELRVRLPVGSFTGLETMLDRLSLYTAVSQQGTVAVPKTVTGDCRAPLKELGGRVIIRPRKTWNGMRKSPRVKLVATEAELQQALAVMARAGLTTDQICFQEVLSLDAKDNVSVCGWFDTEGASLLCTRKLLQHPKSMGNGDVCEIISGGQHLIRVTEDVLGSLGHRGPVEVEFVRDLTSGEMKLIEINPRMWMQHELVGRAMNDDLIRRSLGEVTEGGTRATGNIQFWLNTVYGLSRVLRGQFGVMRFWLSRQTVRVPSLALTLRYLPVLARRRLSGR